MSRGSRLTLHNFSIEKMKTIAGIYRAAMLGLICLFASRSYAQLCNQWKPATHVGDLEAQLKEARGVAVSRKFGGRLYHINDSGDKGRFYITSIEGKDTHAVDVAGFDPVDMEALSLGSCPGGGPT